MNEAISAFSALAHDSRLTTFRLLISVGDEGLAAGEIADRLGLAASTLSNQLAVLERARLVSAHRQGRSIRYTANIEGTASLVAFLTEDCCRGRPDICGLPARETR
ncbi:MAG: ArsR/SmtB family transcription factor [Magnetovibrionaceae bacterium]